MDAVTWSTVQQLFEYLLEHPPDVRYSLLRKRCNDEDILREVESLLATHTAIPEDFLETENAVVQVGERAEPASLVGVLLGKFRILELIAQGGMGAVYLACQEVPARKVAIKVMSLGTWSASARRRFELESQILGQLIHPHIAQVYDVGTHDDLPYFVMEYVPDSLPITKYVEHHKLSIRDRLMLFLDVCDAVQHGHQKGVIHRDLKPGNILVDREGYAKVIDFGVARSTDSDVAVTTMHTSVGQLIGTLQYMSPEQCEGNALDIDVRSDVYSLGVVLFQILCNEPPYDVSGTSIATAARTVCEMEPIRPSTIKRGLRGDLELIILTAIHKHRERRYQSAADLGRDIQHCLDREPIEAKPATWWTRTSRWFRRHPIVTTASVASLVALGIVGGSIATILCAERTPRDLFVTSDFREVRLLAMSGGRLHSWTPTVPGRNIRGILMDAELNGDETKLAMIGFDALDGSSWVGQLCAFDVGSREFDRPLWCDRIREADLPRDPTRVLHATNFSPLQIIELEVFEESVGRELVVIFGHAYSRRSLRVYSPDGRPLYEIWHDGEIHSVKYLSIPKLLVLTGTHDSHLWHDRGATDVPGDGKPRVVWAVHPVLGHRDRRFVCTGGQVECMPSVWYKSLVPAIAAGRIPQIVLDLPEARLNDGQHLDVRLRYDTGSPGVIAGWTINSLGDRILGSLYTSDLFDEQGSRSTPVEQFDLIPLPPIVKNDSR